MRASLQYFSPVLALGLVGAAVLYYEDSNRGFRESEGSFQLQQLAGEHAPPVSHNNVINIRSHS